MSSSQTQPDGVESELGNQRSSNELATIYATAPVGLSLVDADLRFRRINDLQAAMNGHPAEAHLGHTLREMLPQLAETVEPLLRQVLDTGRPLLNIETRGFTAADPDNERTWVANYHPTRDHEGNISGVSIVVNDVTDRVRAQQALRESEERYRLVLRATRDIIWDWDLTTDHVTWGGALRDRLGYVPQDIDPTAAWWLHHIHDEDRERVSKSIYEVLEKGQEHWRDEYRFRRSDGTYATILDRGFVVHDPAGQPQRMIGSMLDLTEQLETAAALSTSEDRFRTLANNIPQLAWMAQPDGWLTWYNQRWFEYTGTTLEQMEGWGWEKVHHPDHVERVKSGFRDALAKGEAWQDVFPLRSKTGRYCWFLSRAMPVKDEQGQITGWFGTNTDVTAEREYQEALRVGEARYRALLESIPQLVWTCTPEGECDYLSRQWIDYTGVPEEQQLGGGWWRQVHPDDHEPVAREWMIAVANGKPMDTEYRIRGADGNYRWFKARAVPLRDAEGNTLRWFGTSTDIDSQKHVEQSLRRSNADLQQFAYVASHDLQEPLRTIAIYTEMLGQVLRGTSDTKTNRYMDHVITAARRMSTLIDDLLAYSRATRDADHETATVDLNRVLDDAVAALRARIEELGASITSSHLPEIEGDAAMLQQVFQNLISNSLKYHRPGVAPLIRIDCATEPGSWRISVRDNGQGFKPEFAETIFGIFKRLHGQSVPGTGIGLAICRTMVERHGGRIWAEGKPGEGSTFYFTLPRIWRNEPPQEESNRQFDGT